MDFAEMRMRRRQRIVSVIISSLTSRLPWSSFVETAKTPGTDSHELIEAFADSLDDELTILETRIRESLGGNHANR